MNADALDWMDPDARSAYEAMLRSVAGPVAPEPVKVAPARRVPPRRSTGLVDKANRARDVQALRDLLTPGPQRSTVARAMLAGRDPSIGTSNRLWSDLRKRAGVVTEKWSDGWYLSLPES